MDITENGFLAATAIIGGIMSVALSSILNCAKRQSTGSRKVLKQKWLYPCDKLAETSTASKRHKGLNLSWCDSGQRKNTAETKEMKEIADNSQKMIELLPTFITYVADNVSVNNDKMEEQTAVAEIGTTTTQMTSTLTTIQSRGNLNPNLNLNHMVSKSNSNFEMGSGNEELPDKLESNVDVKSISLKEKSWISRHCCPHSHDEGHQIPIKHKSCDEMMLEKKMIGEYKLLESVAEMVQKYEEKSRLECKQDNF